LANSRPNSKNRQGNDYGNNYRSIILYTNDEQKNIALQTKKEYQKLLKQAGYGKIVTEIAPLKKFYKAEEHHQNYLKKHPKGYCPNHATGVKFSKSLTPLKGKEIIVVEAANCPFCKKFKKDVLNSYKGSIPLRTAFANELKNYNLKTKIIGTPAIFFIEDGKEVASHIGYLSPKEFYKALGAFKLGKNSHEYKVAFDKKTDKRFCKKYDKFKNAGDGIFIDKISGEPLFDSKDRFNSASGWLSFYKAIPGAVEFREDNSYGIHRIEVIAKKSGIHLGHVFPRYDGKKRFCINASVLEFKAREK
jgi:peptide methionine sulfoxide reductase msrA/msrB